MQAMIFQQLAMINPIMPNCKTNTSNRPVNILEIIPAIHRYYAAIAF